MPYTKFIQPQTILTFCLSKLQLTRPNSKFRSLTGMAGVPRDPSTLSNYHDFKTKHTAVDFHIDFLKKTLTGSVTLNLEATSDASGKEIHLDTSYLDVTDIKINGEDSQWTVLPRAEPFGSKLEIKLKTAAKNGEHISVDVRQFDFLSVSFLKLIIFHYI